MRYDKTKLVSSLPISFAILVPNIMTGAGQSQLLVLRLVQEFDNTISDQRMPRDIESTVYPMIIWSKI